MVAKDSKGGDWCPTKGIEGRTINMGWETDKPNFR